MVGQPKCRQLLVISDFPEGGGGSPLLSLRQKLVIWQDFAENSMNMKEIGPRGDARPWRTLESANVIRSFSD